MLWVGEAPGKVEVLEGAPFVGPTGELVRRDLRWAGVNIAHDVRFTNTCRHNPGQWPENKEQGGELMAMYASILDAEIAEMPNLRVIVACGGVALQRLTGYTNVTDWRGSVLRPKDLPDVLRWSKKHTHVTQFPEGIVIIPTLHPAGIIHSGNRDDIVLFRRDVRKVASAVAGDLKKVQFNTFFSPPPEVVLARAAEAKWVYLDTEYHKHSKELYWVGMTFDGVDVYGMPWEPTYMGAIKRILESDTLIKGAHNIVADYEALKRAGVELRLPWWDTLVGWHTLYATLGDKLGLSDVASYYIDDIRFWKDMDHKDPMYNALDVVYGAQCMLGEWRECEMRPVNPRAEAEARMAALPTIHAMQARGMKVDVGMQTKLDEEALEEIERVNVDVHTKVAPLWDKRIASARAEAMKLASAVEMAQGAFGEACSVHATYVGSRKPYTRKCAQCRKIYTERILERDALNKARKAHASAQIEIATLEKGFKATNSFHLKWLLYDWEGFNLPVQRDRKSRKITTSADAVDKLLKLRYVKDRPSIERAIVDIKRIQHLEKARSTFIRLVRRDKETKQLVSLVGADGAIHPFYKIFGTETGRFAGGRDEDEKSDNAYSVYALNIPKEWRHMYCAPPGHVLIEADWRNMEGRLTAHFSGDKRYQADLDAELKGGPKVHAIHAAVVFGMDVNDVDKINVNVMGRQMSAYDAGKMITHAWSYGMGEGSMADRFRITRAAARQIIERLSRARPDLVAWRQRLVSQVLGTWARDRCIEAGTRYLSNPFGWQRYYMGLGTGQTNEVLAFLPQSSGGSMLVRVLPDVEARYRIFTAVHDSIVIAVRHELKEIEEAAVFLLNTMARPWAELNNRTFPAEAKWGMNWGAASPTNPRGLMKL